MLERSVNSIQMTSHLISIDVNKSLKVITFKSKQVSEKSLLLSDLFTSYLRIGWISRSRKRLEKCCKSAIEHIS